MRNAYKFWSENLRGRRMHRGEDNIRTGLGEIWWENVDLFHLAQDRGCLRAIVNTVSSFLTS